MNRLAILLAVLLPMLLASNATRYAEKIAVRSMRFGASALSADGTQCANPTEVTLNSGPKLYTAICTLNNAATLYFSTVMPDGWDGATVTVEQEVVQTAANTAALHGDIAAQCRGPAETVSSTWGSEVALDIALTGSNAVNHTTSGALTPAGSCAGGDSLFFRWQLDAAETTTAVATLHVLGFKAEFTVLGAD